MRNPNTLTHKSAAKAPSDRVDLSQTTGSRTMLPQTREASSPIASHVSI